MEHGEPRTSPLPRGASAGDEPALDPRWHALAEGRLPPDQVEAEVEALVAAIVHKPRLPIAMGKALFYRQLEVGIEAAYADAGETMACNMMDHSALEGVQAFIDKRKPDWTL